MAWNETDLAALEQELIALRREFHRYPESGWTEFRTTVRVIEELEKLNLPVRFGREIHVRERMMGLPEPERLEACWQRAKAETGRVDLLEPMRGGYTGCVTVIEGALPGPTVAIRVDLDCNEVEESADPAHVPAAEGFASVHPGCMHACGHDAHAAIGIGAAKLLCAAREQLRGRVILIFQPAEEGLRGAASLTAAGVLDSCGTLLGLHVGLVDAPVGTVAAGCHGLLASSKFDVIFHGLAAHAGMAPELGRNAVAAGAKAVLDLLAIPPHPKGISRINVGSFRGGSGRNVIPDRAVLEIETRGADTEINRWMQEEALRLCEAAAQAYGCTCEVRFMGGAGSAVCDGELVERACNILRETAGVTAVLPDVELRVGEDLATMMAAVQSRGGQATELVAAMPLKAPHHNGRFDVDERVILLSAQVLAELVMNIH